MCIRRLSALALCLLGKSHCGKIFYMVICISKFKVVQSDFKQVKEGIAFLLVSVRYKAGCISSEVAYNKEDSITVIIYEEWKTFAEVKRHLMSGAFKKILELMDMSIEIPEVIITESDKVKNLQWIENYILSERENIVNKYEVL